MADYTTAARVKADMPDSTLFADSSTDYDDVVGEMITNASRLIDKMFGRWDNFFYPSTDGETRYFDGSGEEEQRIDECISLSSVSVSESGGRQATDYTDWTEDTDFYVWPYNYSATGKPIKKLIVDNDSGSKGTFAPVRKGVKVTGVFGYSATPPNVIAQACKAQTIRWVMKAKQAWQDGSANPQTGELIYARRLDPDIETMLANLKLEFMV